MHGATPASTRMSQRMSRGLKSHGLLLMALAIVATALFLALTWAWRTSKALEQHAEQLRRDTLEQLRLDTRRVQMEHEMEKLRDTVQEYHEEDSRQLEEVNGLVQSKSIRPIANLTNRMDWMESFSSHILHMPRSICVGLGNKHEFLESFGVFLAHWLAYQSSLLAVINHTLPQGLEFQIKVPWLDQNKNSCKGGYCKAKINGTSMASLLAHHTPAGLPHKVVFIADDKCSNTFSHLHPSSPAPAGYACSWDPFLCCSCTPAKKWNRWHPCAEITRTCFPSRHAVNTRASLGIDSFESYRMAIQVINVAPWTPGDGQYRDCGFWFLRRPLMLRDGVMYAFMNNLAQKGQGKYLSVTFKSILRKVRNLAVMHGLQCVELNYDVFGTHRGLESVTTAFGDPTLVDMSPPEREEVLDAMRGSAAAGVRFYVHPAAESNDMATNSEAARRAILTPLLIAEVGSMWTDYPLGKRCVLSRTSYILGRAPDGEVLHTAVMCKSGESGVSTDGKPALPFIRSSCPAMNFSSAFRATGYDGIWWKDGFDSKHEISSATAGMPLAQYRHSPVVLPDPWFTGNWDDHRRSFIHEVTQLEHDESLQAYMSPASFRARARHLAKTRSVARGGAGEAATNGG